MFTASELRLRYRVFLQFLVAFIALKIEERSNGGVEEGTDVDLEMRRRRSTTTTTTTTIITTIKSKKWPWRRFFRDREFIAIALALFIYRITPTAMDTYNSFVYSIYDEKLPNSAFGMFQFFSSVNAAFRRCLRFLLPQQIFSEEEKRDDENLPPGREELSSDSTAQIQQKATPPPNGTIKNEHLPPQRYRPTSASNSCACSSSTILLKSTSATAAPEQQSYSQFWNS